MQNDAKIAAVFLIGMGCMFDLFGVAAFVTGAVHLSQGGPNSYWGLTAFGFVFSCIGGGLFLAAIFGYRKMKQQEQLRSQYPDQPWMWRADWAQGRARSSTKASAVMAWVFAVLWNLISWPILLIIPREQIAQKPAILLVLVFPISGIAILTYAVRQTLRLIEFGQTWLEFSPVPCVIGRELRAEIHTRFPNIPERGVMVKLTCVRRVTVGSGKDQSTSETILWRDEKGIAPSQIYPGPNGCSIPVRMAIPLNVEATDNSDPRNAVVWRLEAEAAVPGVDYRDIFEVPVFRTKDTPSEATSDAAHDVSVVAAPAKPTVIVRSTADGTEFYFPPARNKGFAGGVTAFTLLWGGVIALIFFLHAPIIFPVFFGLFEAVLVCAALNLWMGTSRVVIGAAEIRVQSGFLGSGRVRTISFSDVVEITTPIRSQQGQGQGTPYYDIILALRGGTKITLGKTIRDKREAEWLASEMMRLIGLGGRAAAATARW